MRKKKVDTLSHQSRMDALLKTHIRQRQRTFNVGHSTPLEVSSSLGISSTIPHLVLPLFVLLSPFLVLLLSSRWDGWSSPHGTASAFVFVVLFFVFFLSLLWGRSTPQKVKMRKRRRKRRDSVRDQDEVGEPGERV